MRENCTSGLSGGRGLSTTVRPLRPDTVDTGEQSCNRSGGVRRGKGVTEEESY